MDKIRLGRTELMVTACSFGALPVQRRGVEDAVKLLRKAYDAASITLTPPTCIQTAR